MDARNTDNRSKVRLASRKPEPNEEKFYTINEVADRLAVSTRTVRRAIELRSKPSRARRIITRA